MSLPTSVEPVNDSLLTSRMAGEWGAAFLAEPCQHIKHARRQELLADFGQ